jgi:hypothetical protein
MSSVRTLMDLLFENQLHDKVLATMDAVRDRQIDGMRFPMDCVTLAAASCYQMVSETTDSRSFVFLVNLLENRQ